MNDDQKLINQHLQCFLNLIIKLYAIMDTKEQKKVFK